MQPEKNIPLEEILRNYFFKPVLVNLSSNRNFNERAYFIGVKLPVREMIMLYYVKEKNIQKYIKNKSARWVEALPYELIETIELLPVDSEITEDIQVVIMLKDITYRE